MKRTYNLPPRTVNQVREMAERYGVAASQDGVVELAVNELARRLHDQLEADAWAAAAQDPAFRAEIEQLEADYRLAERETWPA